MRRWSGDPQGRFSKVVMPVDEMGKYFFVLNVMKHLTNLFILLFWRLSTVTQCYPMSASDPHVETAFSGRRYIMSKPEGLRAMYHVEWHWGCSITANTEVH